MYDDVYELTDLSDVDDLLDVAYYPDIDSVQRRVDLDYNGGLPDYEENE